MLGNPPPPETRGRVRGRWPWALLFQHQLRTRVPSAARRRGKDRNAGEHHATEGGGNWGQEVPVPLTPPTPGLPPPNTGASGRWGGRTGDAESASAQASPPSPKTKPPPPARTTRRTERRPGGRQSPRGTHGPVPGLPGAALGRPHGGHRHVLPTAGCDAGPALLPTPPALAVSRRLCPRGGSQGLP